MRRVTIRAWLPLVALALIVAVLAVWRLGHRPPAPAAPAPSQGPRLEPPWLHPSFLEGQLRRRGLDVHAVSCPDRPDATYIFVGEPDLTLVEELPAEADYADCWRGAVLFDPHGAGPYTDNAFEFRVSLFRVFGDPTLVDAFRQENANRPRGIAFD